MTMSNSHTHCTATAVLSRSSYSFIMVFWWYMYFVQHYTVDPSALLINIAQKIHVNCKTPCGTLFQLLCTCHQTNCSDPPSLLKLLYFAHSSKLSIYWATILLAISIHASLVNFTGIMNRPLPFLMLKLFMLVCNTAMCEIPPMIKKYSVLLM